MSDRSMARRSINEASNIFNIHQINIAKRTLKMPSAMIGVMGGMDKDEARDVLKRLAGWSDAQIKAFEYKE